MFTPSLNSTHPTLSKKEYIINTICVQCGTPFESRTHNAKYCSGKCRYKVKLTSKQYLKKWLRTTYKITLDQYDKLAEAQNHVCAICKKTNPDGRRLYVDHNHNCCPGKRSCGKCIRGLLCSVCNTGLGMFNDDPALTLEATQYLTH